MLLRAGALPADLTIVEERTVGPSLGADSIAAGDTRRRSSPPSWWSLFMVARLRPARRHRQHRAARERRPDHRASCRVLGATLTLPGIAGIVLTMGMAVDSNVLIYERVREELHSGRISVQSLDAGFARAAPPSSTPT